MWEDDGGQAGFEAVRWPHFPSVNAQLEVFVATTDPVAKEPGRGGEVCEYLANTASRCIVSADEGK